MSQAEIWNWENLSEHQNDSADADIQKAIGIGNSAGCEFYAARSSWRNKLRDNPQECLREMADFAKKQPEVVKLVVDPHSTFLKNLSDFEAHAKKILSFPAIPNIDFEEFSGIIPLPESHWLDTLLKSLDSRHIPK